VKILFVASELAPYAKTGGLADVAGALPKVLRAQGHDVRAVLPLYDALKQPVERLETCGEPFDLRLGAHRYRVALRVSEAVPDTWFVDCPALYHRGRVYTSDADEHRRFLALSWAALMGAQRQRFAPDVVHCNDWQTGLLPLTLKAAFGWDRLFARTRTLLTIHNLNYQGLFGAHTLPDTNLESSAHLLHQDQLHHPQGGRINHLLHGIMYADGITTVSPTYGREIQTPAHGAGLDPYLRARSGSVLGVLNGIDLDEWSPEHDPYLPHPYSADSLPGKERNKQALLEQLRLPYRPRLPLLGVVSRMVSQKGLDLVLAVAPRLLAEGRVQIVILGNGEGRLEEGFAALQHHFPRQVCFYRGFSNALAHRIEAGADLFLMPSRYEPCGLN
jgi:starch synthase